MTIGALPLAHQIEGVLAVLGPLCTIAGAVLMLCWLPSSWLAVLGAAATIAALQRVDPVYPEIRRLLALLAVSLAVLATRFALCSRSQERRNRSPRVH